MSEYTNIIIGLYNDALPYTTLFLLIYLIYLLLTKREEFDEIENRFNYSVDRVIAESKFKLEKHYSEMEIKTAETLTNFDDSIEESMASIQLEAQLIKAEFKSFKSDFESLIKEQTRLYSEIKSLNEEIRKRDAIITRKSKQIRELTNGR